MSKAAAGAAFLANLFVIAALAPGVASASGHGSIFDASCDPTGLDWQLSRSANPLARLSAEQAAAGIDPDSDVIIRANQAESPPQTPRASRARATSTVTVPVYFHVVTKDGGTTGAVSDQEINAQIAVLNDAFDGTTGGVDVDFRFVLKRPIDQTESAAGHGNPGAISSTRNVNGKRKMNVYTGSAGGNLGYVNFLPGEGTPTGGSNDFIAIDYRTLPGGVNAGPFELGYTLVHEAGHWLGLEHTFKNGCLAPGDGVADTPYEFDPNYGNSCSSGRDSCPIQAGIDPINNFMDYSDDVCMFEFTPGQANRIHDRTGAYRNNPPTVSDAQLTTTEGTAKAVPLTLADPNGDATVALVAAAGPSHGTVTGSGTGNLVYTPTPGYTGPDQFQVRARDIFGALSALGTVQVQVSPPVAALDLRVNNQERRRLKGVSLKAGCGPIGCDLDVTGKVVARKRRPNGSLGPKQIFLFKPLQDTLGPSSMAKFEPALRPRAARKVKRILRQGGTGVAKLDVAATAAGGQSDTKLAKVRLKR